MCIFPRVFHNNSLCKTWGANRVHYGELENRECRNHWPRLTLKVCEHSGNRRENLEQKIFLESLHSFLDKSSVNERAPSPRVYASLVSSFTIGSNQQWRLFLYIFAFRDLLSTFLWRRPWKAAENLVLTFLDFNPSFLQLWTQIALKALAFI